jgi:hypothetical protein
VQQAGGSATFNYTVTVSESGWIVTGDILITNPNDWEAIAASVTDAVSNGGTCQILGGGSAVVPASSSVTLSYTCTYAAAPSAANGTNTATAAWDSSLARTANAAASGSAGFGFSSLSITDTFDGTLVTLGTISGVTPSKVFTYPHTVTNAIGGSCRELKNTATITETGQSVSQTVNICNMASGALTIGFWQNKNGQGIITGGASIAGVCKSGAWLRLYAPFQDLSATATCGQVATYVLNVVKAANASGASMNAMLKAQMLATALDLYFSTPVLGGNRINAAQPLGEVKIDLTQVCRMIDSAAGAVCSGTYDNVSSAFGGMTALTISQILVSAASQSNAGGGIWYGQVKATQQFAKNTFDAINNQVARIAP